MDGRTATENAERVRRHQFSLGRFVQSRPLCHVRFVKNDRLEWVTGEIKVSLEYYFTFSPT